uniref:Tubulin-specific chaperone A n=1 Tax=Strongyloides venezuelensis TaxID=75913 RepID=A0A0K0F202_STRVS
MDPIEALDERLRKLESQVGDSTILGDSNVVGTIEKLERTLKDKKYGFLLTLNKEDIAHLDKKKIEIEEKDIREKTLAIYYATEKLKKQCKDLEEVDQLSKKVFDSKAFVIVPSLVEDLRRIDSAMKAISDETSLYSEETKAMKIELTEVIKELTNRVSELEALKK